MLIFFTIIITFTVINIHKMSTLSILSDNIRYLRMQIPGLTQRKIAAQLAVTRDSYAKYEIGKTAPPLDVLLALSHYFQVSTDQLLTVDLRKYKHQEMVMFPDDRISLPIRTDTVGEKKIIYFL